MMIINKDKFISNHEMILDLIVSIILRIIKPNGFKDHPLPFASYNNTIIPLSNNIPKLNTLPNPCKLLLKRLKSHGILIRTFFNIMVPHKRIETSQLCPPITQISSSLPHEPTYIISSQRHSKQSALK